VLLVLLSRGKAYYLVDIDGQLQVRCIQIRGNWNLVKGKCFKESSRMLIVACTGKVMSKFYKG